MRPSILVLVSTLAACDGRGVDVDADADVQPATVAAPKTAPAAVQPQPQPPAPAALDALRLHTVAHRRGPLALEVDESTELLRSSIEILELDASDPIAREPRFLAGMPEVVGDTGVDGTGGYRLAARWPHFAILVMDLWDDDAGISLRAARWDGGRWRRDDTQVGAVRRIHTPVGPYTLGTLLTRVDPVDEHESPIDHPRLRRVRSKTLMRRLPDGTAREGPPEPPTRAVVASSASGHVFAGGRGQLSVWSPDIGAWTTSEPPGAATAVIEGFRVFAADDVLAFGSRNAEGTAAWVAHWDGIRWTAVTSPACTGPITHVARHDRRVWVLCRREIEGGRVIHDSQVIWIGDGAGRWTKTALARDAGGAVTAGPIETMVTRDASVPRWAPDGIAAEDLASTRDGTLWIVMREVVDFRHADRERRWLLRSAAAGPVLELPSDDELLAELRGAIGR